MNRLLLFIFLSFYFFACNNNKPGESGKTAFSIDSVKAHIVEMNKSYSKRFTSNDTAFYRERYCADAEIYAPEMPAVKGRDAIQRFFYNDGNNKEAVIELPTGNIYGNPDVVVEEGNYNFPDGKGGSVDKGKFIALWKQEGGKWKLYREMWNSDITPKK